MTTETRTNRQGYLNKMSVLDLKRLRIWDSHSVMPSVSRSNGGHIRKQNAQKETVLWINPVLSRTQRKLRFQLLLSPLQTLLRQQNQEGNIIQHIILESPSVHEFDYQSRYVCSALVVKKKACHPHETGAMWKVRSLSQVFFNSQKTKFLKFLRCSVV